MTTADSGIRRLDAAALAARIRSSAPSPVEATDAVLRHGQARRRRSANSACDDRGL